MRRVFIIDDAMISPLGNTSQENFNNVVNGQTGPRKQHNGLCVSRIDNVVTNSNTCFETLCLDTLSKLRSTRTIDRERTLLVLSTTKGNISLLMGSTDDPRLSLHNTAGKLASAMNIRHFQVVSNACISGVAALLVAKRFIQQGQFDHAVVIGADVLSEFITSGFNSLLALSNEPCRPFDAARKGINLGEAVGAVVLSVDGGESSVVISGGAMTNDANHISGPSRTGEELALAIGNAMKEDSIGNADIDFVSAHGTATIYNDEMETKAFHHAGLDSKPVHSLKGYFGHTLGAAGLIESIMCIHMLKQQKSIGSAGFSSHGVSLPLNICSESKQMSIKRILKTASGFGGTNAAMIFSLKN